MIKVQIVDDHKMFVEGLTKIINESGIAKVINTAHTTAECRKMLFDNLPDILLLDINLPDGNGIDLCSELKNEYPKLKILALTSHSEFSVINRMLENGASGYVLKNAMSEEILQAIEAVAEGKVFLCDDVDLLLKKKAAQNILLTKKERELIRLISEGYINTEIAEKIFLGVETINTYRKNLLFKLNLRNTAMLVKLAIEQKLI